MNKIKPQLPSGMRDFLPADVLRRQYVMDTIAEVFETYGYEPLQTPVLEMQETLMGKYGEDAEKLIYQAKHVAGKEELALRYDLTVPLARAFAMHESELMLPFKRYQIAPVWRGERPGRGRFREFYQCDADVVGIAGMEADAEIVSMVVMAMQKLRFENKDFKVKINNRKILTGIGLAAGLSGEPLANLYRTIDKLDKIRESGVHDEMSKLGMEKSTINDVLYLIAPPRSAATQGFDVSKGLLDEHSARLQEIPIAMEGIKELEALIQYLEAMKVPGNLIEIDFSMVRGLGYYTGPIFETVLISDDPEERVGSVSGGGRYDDMIGLFRKESLPTVGVTLGIERLIILMDKRQLYPTELKRTVVDVLVTVFGPDTRPGAMALASALRAEGIKTELFMQDAKLGRQIGYADKKGIPIVAILGPDELSRGEVKFKRLADQKEVTAKINEAAQVIREMLR